MSTKAKVNTQAKTYAAPAATYIPQPPVAEPEHVPERPDIAAQLEGAARLGHSLGAIGVDSSTPPSIQRQEVSEREEEELLLKREPAAIQRQEIWEEEEEELQLKGETAALQRQELPDEEEEEEEEEGEVQTKPVNAIQRRGQGAGFRLDDETAGRINRARGGGQPLEGALQEQMSASLGYDFSRVRVHTDGEADQLNRRLSAKAFTTGPDIFFKRGAYDPASSGSRGLIAHELGHVVQQSSGRVRGDGSGMTVRPADDAFEHEAAVIGKHKAHKEAVVNLDLASQEVNLSMKRMGGTGAENRLMAARQQAQAKEGVDLSSIQQQEAATPGQPRQPVSVARSGPNIIQRYNNVKQSFKTRSGAGEQWDSEYSVEEKRRVRYAPAKLTSVKVDQLRQTYDSDRWIVGFTTERAARLINDEVKNDGSKLKIFEYEDWWKIKGPKPGQVAWASKTIGPLRSHVFEVRERGGFIHYGHVAYNSEIQAITTDHFAQWVGDQVQLVRRSGQGLTVAPEYQPVEGE